MFLIDLKINYSRKCCARNDIFMCLPVGNVVGGGVVAGGVVAAVPHLYRS